MNPVENLAALRAEMAKRRIDAYVVVTDDFHTSEYVGEHFKAREFLSGFTGSAGTLVVLPESAALWTDGRYFLQASQQLQGLPSRGFRQFTAFARILAQLVLPVPREPVNR